MYTIIILFFGWAITWSNTIIALFLFMGCPALFPVAMYSSVGISSIPIKTKFWFVISEGTILYYIYWCIMVVWTSFADANSGWQIAMKILASITFAGILIWAGIGLYSNSKENWEDEKFFYFPKRKVVDVKPTEITEVKEHPQLNMKKKVAYEPIEEVGRDDFIKRVAPLYPDIHHTEELYDKILSDLEYVKRCREEAQIFADNLNKCPELVDVSIALLEKNDEEYPEFALLKLPQGIKDLVAGRISVEKYKEIKKSGFLI